MALATGELPAAHARSITLDRWPVRALIAAAGLNVIVLLGQLRGLIHALFRIPDAASTEVIAALSANAGPGRVVILGNYPHYEAWWLETATRGLPGHWQLWEAMPFAIAFIGIASMAWAAWRSLGAFAALVTTTVMLSLGDAMREYLFTSATHGYVVAHGALLVVAVVFLIDRAARGGLSWRWLWGLGVPLIALTAVGATDEILEFVFLPSLAIAGCLLWWRHPGPAQRQVAAFCLAVCGASILGAELLDSLMRSQHVIASFFPITFVAPGNVVSNLQLTITSLAHLAGGSFFGLPVEGTNVLIFAVGVLALAGVALVLRSAWQYAKSLDGRHSAVPPAREFYLAFWMLVLVASIAVYALTSLPVNEETARYMPGAYAGTAALLPALAGQRAVQRALLASAIAVFATLIAVNHLIEGTPAGDAASPTPQTTSAMLHFVREHGAQHGYASYEVAPVATWETRSALRAYPVYTCGASLCPLPWEQVSTWYRPQGNVPTFLIANPATPPPTGIVNPPASWGPPAAIGHFGGYTVFIYGHDIASNLG